MNTSYVYVHRTATDGRVFYVGQGVNKRAWSDTGRNPHWHRTVAKYGHIIEIIASCLPKACALSIERAVIGKYGVDNLCNLTSGGDVGPTGMKHSDEVCKAQSERMVGNKHTLGRKLTPEHKAKISAGGKGRVVSEATREKLRLAGMNMTAEHRAKFTTKGIKRSPEWTEKIAASQRGRKMSEEQREKLRAVGFWDGRTGADNPAYGIPKTDAQKARLSEAMTGRKFSAESLAKRSGKGHPRYDPTLYSLTHPEYGEVTAERLDFRDAFGIDATKFTALIRGKRKSCRGWYLTPTPH